MFNFLHLDDQTRGLMAAEVADDERNGVLYISDRLSPYGRSIYPDLLKKAIESHDETWLASELSRPSVFNAQFERKNPKAGISLITMPVDAHVTLGEGEFNRFYCRAICARAVADGSNKVVAVRAKAIYKPRGESLAIEGKAFAADTVLADLRSNVGFDTILGLPAGPNSGMSLRL